MAKRVVAAVRIKKNGKIIDAGSALDAKEFTEAELVRLYDRGVVKVVDDSEPRKATLSDIEDVGKDVNSAQKTDESDEKAKTQGPAQIPAPTQNPQAAQTQTKTPTTPTATQAAQAKTATTTQKLTK